MRVLPLVLAILFASTACDEKATSGPTCGDGVVDVGEQCDGVNLGGDTCESLGYNGGTLACDDQCSFVRTGCESTGRCGDGSIQEPYEACDGEDLGGATCISLGYQGGELSCSDTCALDESGCDPAPVCGDGEITGNEQCDGGHLQNQSCISLGYYPGGQLACDPITCQYDLSGCELYGRCGDGLIQLDEECDGTNFNEETCAGNGFPMGGHLTCNSDCTISSDTCFVVLDLSAGGHHACAVTTDNRAWCWGLNNGGQLGDGTNANADQPVEVAGGYDFTDIEAGISVTCGLSTGSVPYCWGWNDSGALGDGTTSNRNSPTPVDTSETFSQIGPNYLYTCGITSSSEVYCWGSNSLGQFGNGSTGVQLSPAAAEWPNALKFTASTTFACITDGLRQAWCSGDNSAGQLGDGTTTDSLSPVAVTGGLTFSQLVSGDQFVCAKATTGGGTTYCWGANNGGQLGIGEFTSSKPTPQPITSQHFLSITAGDSHACGIDNSNTAYCWGRNSAGQLGDGTTTDSATPVPVLGGHQFGRLVAGSLFTCGLELDGGIYCWGANDRGQLGDGTSTDSSVPVPVAPF